MHTLDELKKMQIEFDSAHEGNMPFFEIITEKNIEVLEHLIVCLVGEIGEFANITKKISRGDFTLENKMKDLREELTDIFIYILKISCQMEIDLEKEYLNKLNINLQRFSNYRLPTDD